ncbi:MAG: hypothetical protein ACRDUA_15495, partial [Micromonosporaceae bacterium]
MSQAGTVFEHPVITGLREAAAGLDTAASSALWQLSDVEVETGLVMVLGLQARAAALAGALLGQAESRDLKARSRASSVQRWLGDRFRLSHAEAAARVRQTALLARHPLI